MFSGACHATAPDLAEGHQEDCCNFGYARGRCDRFPTGSADAVRFSVTDETPSRVLLVFVVEKDHAPVEHGTLEYVIDGARLGGPTISDVLVQQGRAFLESYLSRRARAQAAP